MNTYPNGRPKLTLTAASAIAMRAGVVAVVHAGVKKYFEHRCGARHRTYNVFARCAFPKRTAWVAGEGAFAVVAWCQVPTVTLWKTVEEATRSRDNLFVCGGRCEGRHEVIELVLA